MTPNIILFETTSGKPLRAVKNLFEPEQYKDESLPSKYAWREITPTELDNIFPHNPTGNAGNMDLASEQISKLRKSHDALIDIIGDELNEIRKQAKADPINIREKISEKLKR